MGGGGRGGVRKRQLAGKGQGNDVSVHVQLAPPSNLKRETQASPSQHKWQPQRRWAW